MSGRSRDRATAALLLALPVALLATPGPAAPQADGAGGEAGPASLDAVEAALDSGRTGRARGLFERWLEGRADGSGEDLEPRARFLRARLTQDPDSARLAYTLLAVDGGTPYGVRARLRLAQLRLAEGRHPEALEDLELLRADYPGHPLAAESWLWTGRVREAEGNSAAACEAFRRALSAADADGGLRERARAAVAACEGAASGAPARGETAGGGEAADAPDGAGGAFVVQLGAFSTLGSAERLRQRLAEAGFEARVVGPSPEDDLFRVRSPPFEGRSEADAEAERLENRGFSAIVVRSDSPEGGS